MTVQPRAHEAGHVLAPSPALWKLEVLLETLMRGRSQHEGLSMLGTEGHRKEGWQSKKYQEIAGSRRGA